MAGSDDELARLALIDLESNDGEPQVSELKKGYETQGCVKAASLRFSAFKVSAAGIFILGRWLPLQDVGSDALVTFGPNGLYWDVRNPWWGHLSVFFMIFPYVIMWILISPLIVPVIARNIHVCICNDMVPLIWWLIWFCIWWCIWVSIVPDTLMGPFVILSVTTTCCCYPNTDKKVLGIVLWLIFGLPVCMVLDLMCIVRYPCWQPRLSWLLNAMRLRVVLETILESPAQVGLQTRIFFYRSMSPEDSDMHDDFDIISFGTLLLSIGTSVLSTCLTVQDIRAMAEEQHIGFWEALADQFLVGLGRRAPLLHVVKWQEEVDWVDEGELKDEHFEQISASASRSQALHTLTFHQTNRVSKNSFLSLSEFISRRKHPLMSRVIYDAGHCGDWLWCGCGGFTVEELELNADIWASGKVHLEFHDIIPAQRIEEIAEEATGGSGCYGRVHVVSAGSKGGHEILQDEAIKALAQCLPANALSIEFNFHQNVYMTDSLKALVQSLPVSAIRLNFRGNDKLTDHGLKELVQSLPAAAADVSLNFMKNHRFTDDGLKGLAKGLPVQATRIHLGFMGNDKFTDHGLKELAQSLPTAVADVHLNFMQNNNFTDDGLETLARGLPAKATHIHLDCGGNDKFTDRGLEKLAQSLPAGATDVHLNFMKNNNFSDDGLKALAKGLPDNAPNIHLNFMGNKKFTEDGLAALVQSLPAAAIRIKFTNDGLEAFTRRLPPKKATHIHLDCGGNDKFSDRGLKKLAESLPAAATGVHMNFMNNNSISNDGLKAFAESLPVSTTDVRLNFIGNKNFTQDGLAVFVESLPEAATAIRLELEELNLIDDNGQTTTVEKFINDELRKKSDAKEEAEELAAREAKEAEEKKLAEQVGRQK